MTFCYSSSSVVVRGQSSIVQRASSVNNFTFSYSSWRRQGEMSPLLIWRIFRISKILIVELMTGATLEGPNKQKSPQFWKKKILQSHTCWGKNLNACLGCQCVLYQKYEIHCPWIKISGLRACPVKINYN